MANLLPVAAHFSFIEIRLFILCILVKVIVVAAFTKVGIVSTMRDEIRFCGFLNIYKVVKGYPLEVYWSSGGHLL
jgi:hypothetical protein